MMRMVHHFGITIEHYTGLSIEQYYNYLEEYNRFVDEHKNVNK